MTSDAERVQAARAARLEKATGAELAGWQDIARMWPMTACLADPYLRCSACDQAVIPLADGTGTGYLYSPDEALTLVTAHVRQVHAAAGSSSALPCIPAAGCAGRVTATERLAPACRRYRTGIMLLARVPGQASA